MRGAGAVEGNRGALGARPARPAGEVGVSPRGTNPRGVARFRPGRALPHPARRVLDPARSRAAAVTSTPTPSRVSPACDSRERFVGPTSRCLCLQDLLQLLQVGGSLTSQGSFHEEHQNPHQKTRLHTRIDRHTVAGTLGVDAIRSMATPEPAAGDVSTHDALLIPLRYRPWPVPHALHQVQAGRSHTVRRI